MMHRTFRQLDPRTFQCRTCLEVVVERLPSRSTARLRHAYPTYVTEESQ